jgi:4-amino-4-deoxy-L-arabinose transferase-like glycosyltransferase
MERLKSTLNTVQGSLKREWILITLVMIALFTLRLPYSSRTVIDWDESVYFLTVQVMTKGGVPYRDVWTHKGPILYFILLPAVKIFGNNILALRLYTTFYLLLTTYVVYRIARILYSKDAALISAFAYGAFFQWNGGLASNSELFMMLPASIALFSILKYRKTLSGTYIFISGFFTATAMLVNPLGVFTLLLIPILIVYWSIRDGSSVVLKKLAVYVAGGLTISIAVLAYFLYNGAVWDFIDALIVFNHAYNSHYREPFVWIIYHFFFFLPKSGHGYPITWAFCYSLFLSVFLLENRDQKEVFCMILFLTVSSFFGAIYCGRPFYHYLLPLSLGFSLMIGFGISLLNIGGVSRLIVVVLVFSFVILNHIHGRQQVINYLTKSYSGNEHRIAAYIQHNTVADDKIFIITGEPIIHFLSERRAPTRYFFWLWHTEPFRFFDDGWELEEDMIQKFSKDPPKFIVVGRYKRDVRDYLTQYLSDKYSLEERIGGYRIYKLKE